jgi:hypothetical protein
MFRKWGAWLPNGLWRVEYKFGFAGRKRQGRTYFAIVSAKWKYRSWAAELQNQRKRESKNEMVLVQTGAFLTEDFHESPESGISGSSSAGCL